MSPLGLDTLSLGVSKKRSADNRGNTYPPPLWLPSGNFAKLDFRWGILPAWDCNNSQPAPHAASNGQPGCFVAPPLGRLLGQPQKFPHLVAATYPSG